MDPNKHPTIANTYVVDPQSGQILHRIPTLDSTAHQTYVQQLQGPPGQPNFIRPACACHPRITHYKGDQIPLDIKRFYKKALRWVATETTECLLIAHRSDVERQPIPEYAVEVKVPNGN